MTKTEIDRAARNLLESTEKNKPIDPLINTHGEITVQDGYRIQRNMVEKWTADGRRIVGKKLA